MARKVLLLALDNYQDPGLKLEAPRNDVTLVAETLQLLGYAGENIAVQYSSKDGRLTKSQLLRSIKPFFDRGTKSDDLLLYISGHGVDQDGSRLIVPVDYYRDQPPPPTELVSDHWLYGQARQSPAASVLIVVDSCREGVKVVLAAAKGVAGEDELPPSADASTVGILYSSRPGKFSWAKTGADGTSYFTEAFCHVLRTDESVATLGKVLTATNAYLPKILPAGRQQVAFLDERLQIAGRAGSVLDLIVKEDLAARLRQKITLSRWCKLVQAAPYWPAVTQGPPGLALQLQVLTVRAEDLVNRAATILPEDRWRTEAALIRFLSRVADLIQAADQDPIEAALCLAVPLVYEAILAGLIIRLAATATILEPTKQLVLQGSSSLAARAWRQAIEEEQDWARRREHLSRKDEIGPATDVLCWQLWSFAHRAGELWTYIEGHAPGATGWLNDVLGELFAPAPFAEVTQDRRVTDVLTGRRLVRLARLLFAEPEDIEGETAKTLGGLSRDLMFGTGEHLCRLDEVEVAHLVSLAAGLALDARRLPDLIAEHLGLDGFDLQCAQAELDRAAWQKADNAFVLLLDTVYPPLHAALSMHVSTIERHRHRLDLGRVLRPERATLLPQAIQDTRLLPATDAQDRPVFDPRHLQFSLDQRRIIQLLMGEALYGDPKLALRELYQNALDACRYRRAREAFINQKKPADSTYSGRIVLEAGVDNGRPFVACEDNGIGMGELHMRGLFARAGRRFTDSHEYHLDQAQWHETNIFFWPNSRFGIGVLSYFMLAEEISLETRRLEPDGSLAPEGLVARVTGSGSLFRITRERAAQRGGGTRIILFLKDANADPDDLLASVLDWLFLPEIETVFRWSRQAAQVTRKLTLPPGRPTENCSEHFGIMLPVRPTADSQGHVRVFWTPDARSSRRASREESEVLVDGILSGARLIPSAMLINLTEDIVGTLSVDRRHVTLPSEFERWLFDKCLPDSGHALLEWSDVTAPTLAELAWHQPRLLFDIDRKLREGVIGNGVAIRFHADAHIPAVLGLSIYDDEIVDLLFRKEQVDSTIFVTARLFELSHADSLLPSSLKRYLAFLDDKCSVKAVSLVDQMICSHADRGKRTAVAKMQISDFLQTRDVLQLDLSELIQAVARCVAKGLISADLDLLSKLSVLETTTLSLLSEDLSNTGRYLNKIGGAHLLSAAVKFNSTPQEIAAMAAPLRDLGIVEVDLDVFASIDSLDPFRGLLLRVSDNCVVPALLRFVVHDQIDPEDFAALLLLLSKLRLVVPSRLEFSKLVALGSDGLRLMSRDFDGLEPFVERLTGVQLLRAAVIFRIKTVEVAEMASRLSEFGVPIDVDPSAFGKIEMLPPDIGRLFVDAEGKQIGFPLEGLSPIQYAIKCSLSPKRAAEALVSLSGTGINVDAAPFSRLYPLDNLTARMLSQRLDGNPPYINRLDGFFLNKAMIALQISPRQAEEMAHSLGECGVAVDLTDWSPIETPHRLTKRILSIGLDSEFPWRDMLTAFDLAVASHVVGVDVIDLIPVLNELEGCGVDVSQAKLFGEVCRIESTENAQTNIHKEESGPLSKREVVRQ